MAGEIGWETDPKEHRIWPLLIPLRTYFAQAWPGIGFLASMLLAAGAAIASKHLPWWTWALIAAAFTLLAVAVILQTRRARKQSATQQIRLSWDHEGFTMATANFWHWTPWRNVIVVQRPQGVSFLAGATPPEGSSLIAWVPRRAYTDRHFEDWRNAPVQSSRSGSATGAAGGAANRADSVTYRIRRTDWKSLLRSQWNQALGPSGLKPSSRVQRWREGFPRKQGRWRLAFVIAAGMIMIPVAIGSLVITGFTFLPGWGILGIFAFLTAAVVLPRARLRGKQASLWLPEVEARWDDSGLYRTSPNGRTWIAWTCFKGVHLEDDTLLLALEYQRLGGVSQAVMLPLPAFSGAQLHDIRSRVEKSSPTGPGMRV